MPKSDIQENKMKWVLFWVFMAIYVVIVFGTLWAVFLGNDNVTSSEREILFNAFVVEIGAAVIALFYSVFDLKKKGNINDGRLRLNLGEYEDIKKLVGKKAILSPSTLSNESLDEVELTILDDQGPFLPFTLPPSTFSVYLTVQMEDKTYNGSFVVGNYIVDLHKD